MESGQYLQALQCSEEILSKDETCEQAWDIKAEALDNMGMFEEAVECYSRALNIHQNTEEFAIADLSAYEQISINEVISKIEEKEREGKSKFYKGEALVIEQNYEEGIDYMDEAAVINPEQEMKYKLGALLALKESTKPRRKAHKPRLTEDLKIDLDYYNKILAGDPDNERAWNNKGVVMRQIGEIMEAFKCYAKAVEINPEYSDAWYNMGYAFQEQERYEEAEALLLEGAEALMGDGSLSRDQRYLGVELVPTAIQRVVDVYAAWQDVEPDQGHDRQAAGWRDRLAQWKQEQGR